MAAIKKSIALIGYGNDLCSDDGVGQKIANTVATWGLENLQTYAVHQLTPELAETIARVDAVIFADAYPAGEETAVKVIELTASELTQGIAHSLDPRSLLGLAQKLYDRLPQAWMVAVPAVNFELGESFSPVTESAMVKALEEIDDLLAIINNISRLIIR
ncbi:MAG: hydrogenase maturation protease [Oscillatoriaceae cyanobacterium Prado104]|jgi:hydrogenase maturation protease|nr:hydrogenase maturation protease [Oscillatoriaceae cyanobacterium Prado104]